MTEDAGEQTAAGGRSFLSVHADDHLKFQDLILSRQNRHTGIPAATNSESSVTHKHTQQT